MKKVFSIAIFISVILSASSVFGQKDKSDKMEKMEKKMERTRYEFFKERTISKTYPASGNILSIDNKFGNVKITTWDKNEISVNIHIEASSNNKARADKDFSRIDVKDKQEGKDISFVTNFADENGKDNGCDDCNNAMYIDYDIHIPANNSLDIKNSFGEIDVPDYTGPISIEARYGHLNTGNLSHPGKLDVEFSSSAIKSLSNADAKFRYGSVTIDNIAGTTKMDMEFCSFSKINLAKDLTSLTIDVSYGSLNLLPAANFSGDYDITASYGSVVDKTGGTIKRTDEPGRFGPDLTKHYQGKSGSGSTKITVKSSFGSILIGEGTEDDLKEKKRVRS